MSQVQLLTVREASQQLGLHESTIRKWIMSRRLGACKIGRAVRIPASTVQNLINRGYKPSVSDVG
jgi:excisionase family DNA binding protein